MQLPNYDFSDEKISIENLLKKIDSGDYVLNPDHQRDEVWAADRKIAFINSIWSGISIPPLYLVKRYRDSETKKPYDDNWYGIRKNLLPEACEVYYEVIDGLQRASSIKDYIHNIYSLSKELSTLPDLFIDKLEAKKWEDVNESNRKSFLDKQITVIIYETYGVNEIEIKNLIDALFQSYNQSENLNDQEKLRSKYRDTPLVKDFLRPFTGVDGPYSDMLIKASSTSSVIRQWDGRYLTALLYYIHNQEHLNGWAVANVFKYFKNNEEDIDMFKLIKNIKKSLEIMKFLFDQTVGLKSTRFAKGSNFYALNVVIIDWILEGREIDKEKLLNHLKDLSVDIRTAAEIKSTKVKNDLDEYSLRVNTSGHTKVNRGLQNKILHDHLDCCTDKTDKDPSRKFSEVDRKKQYHKQDGYCSDCDEQFDIDDMDAHHIIPHGKGGLTVPKNCTMLCKECHKKTYSQKLLFEEQYTNKVLQTV